MLLDGFLRASAQSFPAKTALVCAGRRLTYAWLDETTDRMAIALGRFGVRRGDRVVIHLENSVETVLAIFATLKAGGVFVLVNPTTKTDKLAYIVNDCQAGVLISDMRAEGTLGEVQARAPLLGTIVLVNGTGVTSTWTGTRGTVSFQALTAPQPAACRATPTRIDLDLAAIVYTSGSTGVPKGVVLSHENMVAAATSITSYLENTADDVILNVLPLSFDYGLYQLLMACKVGATLVLERSFVYPPVILDTLVRERVTGFPIVPTIAAMLLRHDLQSYDFSALRYITSTGAALPSAHIAWLRSMLPAARLYSMYGITESKRVSYLPPDQIDSRPTSVGKPMPNVEVFVCDESGQLRETGTGELVVRGATVMQGYWGKPEESARTLGAGRFPGERLLYTGDIFRIDDDGYLYFVSRRDDIIKSRGEKVSPREVENVLHDLPGVIEAVVVGVPDEVLGQAIKACVKVDPESGLSERDVASHCAQRLEDFMVPKIVEFVQAMPRTTTGKVNRRELVARLAS